MFFIDYEFPSCSSCQYANKYIPYYTFPYSDPYCEKGHGLCEVDKLCGDYRLINSHFCCECEFYNNGFCSKHNKTVNENDKSCVYFFVKE